MISVSSITTFDIYKKYINPKAHNKSLIFVSHIACIIFTFGAAGFSLMLHYVGVNMTWFGYFTPLIICPGVIPLIMSIVWNRQSWYAAVMSPILGIVFGFTVWTTTAYKLDGAVNITTLGGQLPALYGALTALFLPGIASVIITLAHPQKFDWKVLQQATILVDEEGDSENTEDNTVELVPEDNFKVNKDKSNIELNIESDQSSSTSATKLESQPEELPTTLQPISPKELDLWIKISTGAAIFVLLIMWVLWPLPLYRNWIFTREYFKGYVTVGLMWLYATLLVIGIGPLVAGRHTIAFIVRSLYRDYIKRK